MVRYSLESVTPGMTLAEPIYFNGGGLLLGAGIELTDYYIRRIGQLGITTVDIVDDRTMDIDLSSTLAPKLRQEALSGIRSMFGMVKTIAHGVKLDTSAEILDFITSTTFAESFKFSPEMTAFHKMARHLVESVLMGKGELGTAEIKTPSNYLYQHSLDVAMLSILLGRRLGLNHKRLADLCVGGLLHDIGRVFVPQDVESKPERLNDREYITIKYHPIFGFRMLHDIPSLGVLPPHIAFQHHERQNGSGYPRGLIGDNSANIGGNGESIHLYGSIAAIADVYDALVSARPWRPAYPPDLALAAMREMDASQLNDEALTAFLAFVPPYPIGQAIRVLSGRHTGWTGIVVSLHHGAPTKPLIRLLNDPAGNPIDPRDIDLCAGEPITIETVMR